MHSKSAARLQFALTACMSNLRLPVVDYEDQEGSGRPELADPCAPGWFGRIPLCCQRLVPCIRCLPFSRISLSSVRRRRAALDLRPARPAAASRGRRPPGASLLGAPVLRRKDSQAPTRLCDSTPGSTAAVTAPAAAQLGLGWRGSCAWPGGGAARVQCAAGHSFCCSQL